MYPKKFSCVVLVTQGYLAKNQKNWACCDFSHCVPPFYARILYWFSTLPFFQHYLPYPAMLFKKQTRLAFCQAGFLLMGKTGLFPPANKAS
jgi:hypothetical protein